MFLVTSVLKPTPTIDTAEEYHALSQSIMDEGHAAYLADLQSSGKLVYRAFSFDTAAKTIEVVSLWASQADYLAHTAAKAAMWARMEAAGIATLSKNQQEI